MFALEFVAAADNIDVALPTELSDAPNWLKMTKLSITISLQAGLAAWSDTCRSTSITRPLYPKGIPQQSPGLRGTSCPGNARPIGSNPERVAARGNGNLTRPQPRWGCASSTAFTQGSSFLATLGVVAESLWDSALG